MTDLHQELQQVRQHDLGILVFCTDNKIENYFNRQAAMTMLGKLNNCTW
jgi:hypothetical protein